jgi:hypothetical protein
MGEDAKYAANRHGAELLQRTGRDGKRIMATTLTWLMQAEGDDTFVLVSLAQRQPDRTYPSASVLATFLNSFRCRIHLAGGIVVVVVVVVVDVELVGSLGLLGLSPVASLARALV